MVGYDVVGYVVLLCISKIDTMVVRSDGVVVEVVFCCGAEGDAVLCVVVEVVVSYVAVIGVLYQDSFEIVGDGGVVDGVVFGVLEVDAVVEVVGDLVE